MSRFKTDLTGSESINDWIAWALGFFICLWGIFARRSFFVATLVAFD
jgi:hypothetical protein